MVKKKRKVTERIIAVYAPLRGHPYLVRVRSAKGVHYGWFFSAKDELDAWRQMRDQLKQRPASKWMWPWADSVAERTNHYPTIEEVEDVYRHARLAATQQGEVKGETT
jgi:hypothetical protein